MAMTVHGVGARSEIGLIFCGACSRGADGCSVRNRYLYERACRIRVLQRPCPPMLALCTNVICNDATDVVAAEAGSVYVSASALEELLECVQTALSVLEPDALRTLAFEEVLGRALCIREAFDRVGRVLHIHTRCDSAGSLENKAAALAETGAYIVRTVGYPVRCGVRYVL
jgi:hypothetical protein